MKQLFNNKSQLVVITGATKGIGRSTAVAFAKRGYDLAICARTKTDVEELQKELEGEFNIKVLAQPADMSHREEVAAFSDMIGKSGRTVDILINNAGLFANGTLFEEEDGTLDKMLQINLMGAYYLTRHLIPLMRKSDGGHIFNLSSVAGIVPLANCASYTMSRYAMTGFSKVLREELKGDNIKVTTVIPGATWSASWEGVELPRERLMEPEHIAMAIVCAAEMGGNAVVEELIIRPLKGDL